MLGSSKFRFSLTTDFLSSFSSVSTVLVSLH
jgi:hypothetical protein